MMDFLANYFRLPLLCANKPLIIKKTMGLPLNSWSSLENFKKTCRHVLFSLIWAHNASHPFWLPIFFGVLCLKKKLSTSTFVITTTKGLVTSHTAISNISFSTHWCRPSRHISWWSVFSIKWCLFQTLPICCMGLEYLPTFGANIYGSKSR